MKTTRYFDFRRQTPDRVDIRDEWIQRVLAEAKHSAVQGDGRIRVWGQIAEAGGKWLRVVVLDDGQTVHNAFFDRDFTGG
jgi:hypothetical protein